MEINNNDLHKYIRLYNDFLPEEPLKSLITLCKNYEGFSAATIVRNNNGKLGAVDEKIRKTQWWDLNYKSKSLTTVHWYNFLGSLFNKAFLDYENFYDLSVKGFRINDIQILKYVDGGHYEFHSDHSPLLPRTYSSILFLNDDFEGGDLLFKYPLSKQIVKIPKKKNTLIVWPSNFLFPHKVTPVTKGERYSVVSWAL